ncbi:MAG: tail protein X [Oscillospiraceae bacterium]|jgi:phage tail protein X|nr:tail protein X [Oscillospiraceae bacterium]
MSTYTTIQGDMWDSIAYMQFGSTAYTDELMRANPEHLDKYVFPAGVVLTLPEVEAAVTSEDTAPWRRAEG